MTSLGDGGGMRTLALWVLPAAAAVVVSACGGTSALPTKIPALTAPSASVSMGLPSGMPESLNGMAPSPAFMLKLNQYTPGDTFVLDYSPPDPSFVLYDPNICGPSAKVQCYASGSFGKGPFYGLQLVGTIGHYRFIEVAQSGQQTVIAEGDVDVTQASTVIATYPPSG